MKDITIQRQERRSGERAGQSVGAEVAKRDL